MPFVCGLWSLWIKTASAVESSAPASSCSCACASKSAIVVACATDESGRRTRLPEMFIQKSMSKGVQYTVWLPLLVLLVALAVLPVLFAAGSKCSVEMSLFDVGFSVFENLRLFGESCSDRWSLLRFVPTIALLALLRISSFVGPFGVNQFHGSIFLNA